MANSNTSSLEAQSRAAQVQAVQSGQNPYEVKKAYEDYSSKSLEAQSRAAQVRAHQNGQNPYEVKNAFDEVKNARGNYSSDPFQGADPAEYSYVTARQSGRSSADYLAEAQRNFDITSSARDDLNRQLDELKRQEIRSYDIYTGKSSVDNAGKIDALTKQLEDIQRQYDRYEKELGFARGWKQEDDDKAWVREHHDDYGNYNGVYGATVRSIEQLSAERDRLKALLPGNVTPYASAAKPNTRAVSARNDWNDRSEADAQRVSDERNATARQLEMIERALADMQRRQQLAQYMLTEDDDATESIHRGQKAIEAADLENAATANARYDRAMGDESISNQLGGEGSVDYEGFRKAEDQARANRLDTSYKRPTEQWNYDERATFYILADRYGIKAASDYAAQVNTAHNNAAASEKTKAWEEAGRGMPTDGGRNPLTTVGNFGVGALGVAGQVALAPIHAISWADKLITSLKQEGYYTGRANPWITDYANAYTAGRARGLNEDYGTISKDAKLVGGLVGGKGLGDLYQLGISTAQSLAYGNLAGEAATLAIFFGQAADTSFDEAINMGMSAEQATVYSALSGAAEVIGEKISLDNLLNADAAATRSLIKNILIQGGIEGSEEAFTDLLNIFGDAIAAEASGGRSKRERELDAYMQQGMSYDDAQKQLVKDFLKEAAADAIGGAISGGFSGFIQNLNVSASQYMATKQAEKQFTSEYNTAAKTGDFTGVDTQKLSAMYQLANQQGDQQTKDKILAEITERVAAQVQTDKGKDFSVDRQKLANAIKAQLDRATAREEEGFRPDEYDESRTAPASEMRDEELAPVPDDSEAPVTGNELYARLLDNSQQQSEAQLPAQTEEPVPQQVPRAQRPNPLVNSWSQQNNIYTVDELFDANKNGAKSAEDWKAVIRDAIANNSDFANLIQDDSATLGHDKRSAFVKAVQQMRTELSTNSVGNGTIGQGAQPTNLLLEANNGGKQTVSEPAAAAGESAGQRGSDNGVQEGRNPDLAGGRSNPALQGRQAGLGGESYNSGAEEAAQGVGRGVLQNAGRRLPAKFQGKVIEEADYTGEQREVVSSAREDGFGDIVITEDSTFIINGVRASGYASGNGNLILGNTSQQRMTQIKDHECIHLWRKAIPNDARFGTLKKIIAKICDNQSFKSLYLAYASGIESQYPNLGKTDFYAKVLEEILGDMHGGLSRFGTNAGQYQEAAKKAVAESGMRQRFLEAKNSGEISFDSDSFMSSPDDNLKHDINEVAAGNPGSVSDDGLRAVLEYTLDKLSPRTGNRTETVEERIANIYLSQSKFQDDKNHRDTNYLAYSKLNPNQQTDAFFVLDTVLKEIDSRGIGLSKPNKPTAQVQNTPLPSDEDISRIGSKLLADEMNAWRNEHADGTLRFEDLLKDGPRSERLKDFMNGNLQYGELWTASERRELIEDTFGVPCHLEGKRVVVDNESDLITAGVDNGAAGIYGAESHDFGADEEASEESKDFRDESITEIEENVDQGDLRRDLNALRKTSKAEAKGEKPGRNSNYVKGAIPTLPEQHGWISTSDKNEDYSDLIQELLYDAQYLEWDIDILNRRIAVKEQRGDYDSIKSDLKKLAELKRKLTTTNRRLNGLEKLSKNAEARTEARERARSEVAEEKAAEARKRELGISREQVKRGRRLSQEEIERLKQNASQYEASRPSEERNSDTRNDELAHLSKEETERLFPGGDTQVPGKTTRFNEPYEPGAKETSTIPAESSPEISERNRQASSEAGRSRGESVNTDNISAETMDRLNEMFSERLGIKNTGNTAVATGTPAGITKDPAPQNALETSDEFDAVNTGSKLVSDEQLQEQQTSNEHDIKFTDEQKENKLIPKRKKPSGYTARDNEIGVWMSPDVFAKTSTGKEMEARRSEFDALRELRQGYYDKYDLPGISRVSRGLKDSSGYRANRSTSKDGYSYYSEDQGQKTRSGVEHVSLADELSNIIEGKGVLFQAVTDADQAPLHDDSDDPTRKLSKKERQEQRKRVGNELATKPVSAEVANGMLHLQENVKGILESSSPIRHVMNLANSIVSYQTKGNEMGWLATDEIAGIADDIRQTFATREMDNDAKAERLADLTVSLLATVSTRVNRAEAHRAMELALEESAAKYGKRNGKEARGLKRAADWYKSLQINPATGFKMLDGFRAGDNGEGYKLARRINDSVAKEQMLFADVHGRYAKLRGLEGMNDFVDGKSMSPVTLGTMPITEQQAIDFIKEVRTLQTQNIGAGKNRLDTIKGFAVKSKDGSTTHLDVGSLVATEDADGKKLTRKQISEGLVTLAQEMEKSLSPAAKQYLEITNGILFDLGKQVSSARQRVTGLGFREFESGNYYPVKYVSKNNSSNNNDSDSRGIFNPFGSRTRTEGGYVQVASAADTVDRYIDRAIYAAAYGELADTLDFLNSSALGTQGLANAVSESFGKDFGRMFENYVADVNNRSNKNKFEWSPMKAARLALQQGALRFSVSVPIKQTASYWDAAGVLSMESLLKAYRFKATKAKGYGAENKLVQSRAAGQIDPTLSEVLNSKGYIADLKKRSDVARAIDSATSIMDYRTIDDLFHAAVIDTQLSFSDIDPNSKMFKDIVAAKFQDVVLGTQPIFSKNARAEGQRTNNELIRSMSMFRTQQTQNLNRAITAIGEYKAAKGTSLEKISRKELQRTVAGQIMASVEFGLLSVIADLARHKLKPYRKDEDDDTIDPLKILARVGLNSIESAAGTAWFGDQASKALIDIAMGDKSDESGEFYGLNLGLLSSAVKAMNGLSETAGTIANAARTGDFSNINISSLRYSVTNAAQLFGLPINNVISFANSLAMYGLDIADAASDHKSGNRGVYDDAIKMFNDILHGKYTQTTAQHQADKFFRKGDTENLLYNISILEADAAARAEKAGGDDPHKGHNYLAGLILGTGEEAKAVKAAEQAQYGRTLSSNERIANYLVDSSLDADAIDEAINQYATSGGYNVLYNALRASGMKPAEAVSEMYKSDRKSGMTTNILDEDNVELLLSGVDAPGETYDVPALDAKNVDEYVDYATAVSVYTKTENYGELDKMIHNFSKLDKNTQAVLSAKDSTLVHLLECSKLGVSSADFYAVKSAMKDVQVRMDKSTATGTDLKLIAIGETKLTKAQRDALVNSEWMGISKTGKSAYSVLSQYGMSAKDVGEWIHNADWSWNDSNGTISNIEAAQALRNTPGLTDSQRRTIYNALRKDLSNYYNDWGRYTYDSEIAYIDRKKLQVGRSA